MTDIHWSTALGDPAELRARGLFVAEGRQVLQRVIDGAAGGPEAVVAVLATPAAAQALGLESRLGDRLTSRSPREMEGLTGFNFHRGVLALVRRPPPSSVHDIIALAVADSSGGGGGDASKPVPGTRQPVPGTKRRVLVVAEHLVDVDNVGSCFRNARAFGATAVLIDERCPDPLYRKAVRTSLGTVLEVPWAQAPIRELLDGLDHAGVTTIGLTPDGGTRAGLAEVGARMAADTPVALVVGNEGEGLSNETRARCAHLARIPMADGADSLNVATALAVALYEWQVRQR